jgi:lysophospholipase L1-like esterase
MGADTMPSRHAEAPRPHGIKLVLFWAILAIATLGFCELLVRLGLPPLDRYPGKPSEDALLMADPVRGYGLRPGATSRHHTPDFDVRFEIDSRGLRDGPFEDALTRDFRILAVGDSYTMGLAVDERDRYSDQLEALLEARLGAGRAVVVNAGVPGYSVAQIRKTAEALLPELRPQVLIVGLYASSYWRMDNPYVLFGGTLISTSELPRMVLIDGDLLGSPFAQPRVRALDLFFKRHFQLGARLLSVVDALWTWFRGPVPGSAVPAPDAPRDAKAVEAAYQPALEELQRMNELAERYGAALVVLMINRQEVDGTFDPLESTYNEIVTRFGRERGIRVVDPLPDLVANAQGRPVFRYPDNIHWTPRAHRLVANLLLEDLERAHLLASTSDPTSPHDP